MYISAALVGLAAAPLWTAQALYINRIGRYHAQHKCQTAEVSVGLFFGLFMAFLVLNQIRLAKRQTIRQSMKKSMEVLVSLIQWKYMDQIFLIPLTMWSLIQSTFLTAQFTRAFITCLIGIR
ncbi:unnamed protein product [Rotaria sordida]|uniref:Uncharacterized protein n=2 Tax=Rotaria sordida TaxID=392033 RepID=A0A815CXQ8_9BILA|nr:unnamed protein product [Rotaria sordida]